MVRIFDDARQYEVPCRQAKSYSGELVVQAFITMTGKEFFILHHSPKKIGLSIIAPASIPLN
jgi:hypothetical protein